MTFLLCSPYDIITLAGHGMVIIHDFVEYIQNEPYTLAIIKPYLSYVQEQTALWRAV